MYNQNTPDRQETGIPGANVTDPTSTSPCTQMVRGAAGLGRLIRDPAEITPSLLLDPAPDAGGRPLYCHAAGRKLAEVLDTARRLGLGDPTEHRTLARIVEELCLVPGADGEIPQNRQQPLFRTLSDHPLWSSMVPVRLEQPAHRLDVIRAVLIFARLRRLLLLPDPRRAKTEDSVLMAATEGNQQIVARMSRPRPSSVARTSRIAAYLNEQLTLGAGTPRLDLDDPASPIGDMAGASTLRREIAALNSLLDVFHTEFRMRRISAIAARMAGRRSSMIRPSSGAVLDVLEELPGFSSQDEGISPDDMTEARWYERSADQPEPSASQKCGVESREARLQSRLRVQEGIAPGSDRSLSRTETRRVAQYLYKHARLSSDSANWAVVHACMELLLVLATGRSQKVVASALSGLSQTSGELAIHANSGAWTYVVPAGRYWKPPQHLDRSLFLSHTDILALPLPRKLLHLLRAPPFISKSQFPISVGQLGDARRDLLKTIQQEACPRFTVARLGGYLPAALIQDSGDIPTAQLICGDYLGFSPASLNYFAARIESIARLYSSTMESVLGPIQWTDIPDRDMYVGALAPLFQDNVVRTLVDRVKGRAKAFAKRRRPRRPGQVLQMRLEALDALSRYTSLAFAASSGHRMTVRTGDLTLNHLLLRHTGFCTVSDKLCNLEHISRIVASAPLVAEQIDCYLQALSCLLADLELLLRRDRKRVAGMMSMVSAALDGSGPLFLCADGGALKPLPPTWLADELPPGIPRNVLRHRFSRRMRELGAPPLDVTDQLGHYFLGQPFGPSSPQTPQQFADRLVVHISNYLEADGWEVVSLPATGDATWQQHWTTRADIARDCRQAVAREAADWRNGRRAFFEQSKTHRRSVDQAFEAALSARCQPMTLVEPPKDVSFNQATLALLVADVAKQLPESVHSMEFVQLRLRYWLNKFAKTHAWKTPLPGRLYIQPTEPSVLTHHHLHAAYALGQLQAHIWQYSAGAKSPSPEQADPGDGIAGRTGDQKPGVSDFHPSVRQLSASLLLDLGLTDPRMALGAIANISNIRRLASLSHVLILPITDGNDGEDRSADREEEDSAPRRRCSQLVTGHSAAALLACHRLIQGNGEQLRFPITELELSRCIRPLIPPQLRARKIEDTWTRVADLVELALRVHRAGPIPMTRTPLGSATLPDDRMETLLTNAARVGAPSESSPITVVRARRTSPDCRSPLAAHEEYDGLRSALYKVARSGKRPRLKPRRMDSPDPPRDEPAPDATAPIDDLQHLILKVKGFREVSDPTVKLLASYAAHLLSRSKRSLGRRKASDQKAKSQRLAVRSVYEYVVSIGTALLDALAGRHLPDLDADDLQSAYSDVILSKPLGKRVFAYDRLREFHTHLRQHHDVPPISFHELADDLPDIEPVCEASVITTEEFGAAIKQIDVWISRVPKRLQADRKRAERPLRIAKLALFLMYRCGLRIGEVRRLRFADLDRRDGDFLALIHSNQYGCVKTKAGRRLLNIEDMAQGTRGLATLCNWLDAEQPKKNPLGGVVRNIDPVFSDADDPHKPIDYGLLLKIMKRALVVATGNPDARPHWLRHTWAMTWLCRVDLPRAPKGTWGLPTPEPQNFVPKCHPRIWALWVSSRLGHARVETSYASYYHLQSIRGLISQTRSLTSLEWTDLARAFGLNAGALRQWRHKNPNLRDNSVPLLAYLIRAFGVPISRNIRRRSRWEHVLPFRLDLPPPMTLPGMVQFLSDLQRGAQWADLARRHAIRSDQALRLADGLLKIQKASRCWTVPAASFERLRRDCDGPPNAALEVFAHDTFGRTQLAPVLDLARHVEKLRVEMSRSVLVDLRRCATNYSPKSGFLLSDEADVRSMNRVLSVLGLVTAETGASAESSCDGRTALQSRVAHRHIWHVLISMLALTSIRRAPGNKTRHSHIPAQPPQGASSVRRTRH